MSERGLGFPCLGGKQILLPVLKEVLEYIIENHNIDIMVDMCGGGGKIALGVNNNLLKETIYNDLETGMSNLMAVLKDEVATDSLIILIEELTSTVRNPKLLFEEANSFRNLKDTDILHSAAYTFISIYGSFGTNRKSFNMTNFDKNIIIGKKHFQLGKYNDVLRNIRVLNKSCFNLLENYGQYENILAFLDVPYVSDTMKGDKHYENNFTNNDHERLVDLLTNENMNMKWVLCGFDNDIYKRLESSGLCRKYYVGSVQQSSGSNSGSCYKVEEYIWTNVAIPGELLPKIKKKSNDNSSKEVEMNEIENEVEVESITMEEELGNKS